jgi:hypothetical protein
MFQQHICELQAKYMAGGLTPEQALDKAFGYKSVAERNILQQKLNVADEMLAAHLRRRDMAEDLCECEDDLQRYQAMLTRSERELAEATAKVAADRKRLEETQARRKRLADALDRETEPPPKRARLECPTDHDTRSSV